jgi:hypothetical protein
MKINHPFLIILFAILFLSLGISVISAKSFVSEEKFLKGVYTLKPGMLSSCQNDFIIENAGKNDAEYLLILGEEDYVKGKINGNAAKAYSLSQSIGAAKMEGMPVESDDVATIVNMGDNTKIKLYCVE